MPVVRTRSQHGLHGLPFLDGDLGQVDPLLDTTYADMTIQDPSVPFGPQPTQETVATNWLVDQGYITDPGLTPPAPTVSVPSSGMINVSSGLQVPSGSGVAAGLQTLPPGPSPRVNVPLTGPYASISSIGQFLTGSTIISGVPNVAVVLGGFLAASLLLSGTYSAGRYRIAKRK